MGLVQQGVRSRGVGKTFSNIVFGTSQRPSGFAIQYGSYPSGLGLSSFPSIKAGFIAARVYASSILSASLSGVGSVSALVVGIASVLGSPNIGLHGTGTALGLATVNGTFSGTPGVLSGFIRIGANPSAVDIAGEILDVQTVTPGGPTVREALALLPGVDKKTATIIGLTA